MYGLSPSQISYKFVLKNVATQAVMAIPIGITGYEGQQAVEAHYTGCW
jgi:hypothetical protein